MDGFYQCIQRMVLTSAKRNEISKQLEVYKLSTGTFGYDMAIQDGTARMLGKIQGKFISIFTFKFPWVSFL